MTHVLIGDDSGAIRRTVRAILEFAGYVVCEAADGMLALEHLRTHPHGHVILLDVEMPRMNGVRALEALACQPPLIPQHAVIIITASAQELPPAVAHVPVVSKPFDIDVLMTHVECAARHLASSAPAEGSAAPSTSLRWSSCSSPAQGNDCDSFCTASQPYQWPPGHYVGARRARDQGDCCASVARDDLGRHEL